MTASARGDNHRSGFHSYESGPHKAGSVLQLLIDIMAVVPFGTTISLISRPSIPVTGVYRGSTASFRTLELNYKLISVA